MFEVFVSIVSPQDCIVQRYVYIRTVTPSAVWISAPGGGRFPYCKIRPLRLVLRLRSQYERIELIIEGWIPPADLVRAELIKVSMENSASIQPESEMCNRLSGRLSVFRY